MHNVSGAAAVFVGLLMLIALLIRRPLLALLAPVSLIVFQDFGSLGVVLLWAALLMIGQWREREAAVPR